MAIQELTKLFNAIGSNDIDGAKMIAAQIADKESKKGHYSAANRLKGALRPNSTHLNQTLTPEPAISAALARVSEKLTLGDLVLGTEVRRELKQLSSEWVHRNRLESVGLKRRTKILFYGPPGCGKSVCARALGSALSLPVYVVKFDTIIGAYLGQTAVNIRELFRFAERSPSLLIIDEIDAIGKRRGNSLDVGELDRIVISLLQEMEHSDPSGLVVATSNLPEHLDEALVRRFDLTLSFKKPSRKDLLKYAQSLASNHRLRLNPRLNTQIGKCKNFAEAKLAIESEALRVFLGSF